MVKRDTSLMRKPPNRNPLKRILIVCQSQQTEPNYFTSFCRHNELTSVQVLKGEGGHTSKPIDKNTLVNSWKKEFDEIWYVFDTEDLNDSANRQHLNATLRKTTANKIKIGLSNPCFEYWILLYEIYTTRPFANARETIQELKRNGLSSYEKSMDIFSLIRDRTDNAIQNSINCLMHHENLGHLNYEDRNPCTTVHELVQVLNGLRL